MMKTKYKFIEFVKNGSWWCKNKFSLLGKVEWYPQWKQYIYIPQRETVYSTECLDDISHFIGQLSEERNNEKV